MARKVLNSRTNSTLTFPDHNGQPYVVVGGRPSQCICGSATCVRKLGIQLYLLKSEEETTTDGAAEEAAAAAAKEQTQTQEQEQDWKQAATAIGAAFLSSDAIAGWGNARNHWPRVDVHGPQPSIAACIAHHKREKAWRAAQRASAITAAQQAGKEARAAQRRASGTATDEEEEEDEARRNPLRGAHPLPHIPATWVAGAAAWHPWHSRPGHRYRSFVLAVPADGERGGWSWESVRERTGLWLAQFEQDVAAAMETEEADDEQEDGWVSVYRVDWGPAENVERVCLRDGVRANAWDVAVDEVMGSVEARRAGLTPGCRRSWGDVWIDATGAFSDCMYKPCVCERCDWGEVGHAGKCESELEEHFFGDDGQCVACRQATEYRRRSRRIRKRVKMEEKAVALALALATTTPTTTTANNQKQNTKQPSRPEPYWLRLKKAREKLLAERAQERKQKKAEKRGKQKRRRTDGKAAVASTITTREPGKSRKAKEEGERRRRGL
ncbi:uncharacterized protein K452DRAFT_31822 [Aplosporella prunicola CBS 121167]|uniref:Uncharacterized protein n=1 Tax=Aplosporella prunicola CBS 121167 TaxID=1176127 RepID=A0A6A6BBU1_9PEZI|nr:uncharacterized protein K452DRAFT_31822 [Aplosporella prunicola CBS 121167]KAF2141669.1 hypothetical protein K452DRAFT_31822 [Aplosporella prunicola CBS 121167]